MNPVLMSMQQLLQFKRIQLKSCVGDFVHRPDTPQGVTTWNTGVGNVWNLIAQPDGRILLQSWKGDYLYPADGAQCVTTQAATAGSAWAVEFNGETIRLRSASGDYLVRSAAEQGLSTGPKGERAEWYPEVLEWVDTPIALTYTNAFDKVWDDSGSGAIFDCAIYRPRPLHPDRVVSGMGAMAVGGNRPYAFVVGDAGMLSHNWWDGSAFQWTGTGAPPDGATMIECFGACLVDNRPYVFVKGSDGVVWQNYWDGSRWIWANNAKPASCTIEASLGVTVVDGSRPYVFLKGSDGNLWQNYWEGRAWIWVSNGKPPSCEIGMALGAIAVSGNRPYIFVKGSDGNLWQNLWDGSKWIWAANGKPPGAEIADALGALDVDGGRPYVFVKGSDGNLWQNHWDGSRWVWYNSGKPPTCDIGASLGVLKVGTGRPYVFVKGSDGSLWQNYWDGSRWIWASTAKPVSCDIAGPVGATVVDGGRPYVYVMGSDGKLWQNWWDGHQWHWTDLGSPTAAFNLGFTTFGPSSTLPPGGLAQKVALTVRPLTPGVVALPSDYTFVGNDAKSGAHDDCSWWAPVPPPGFVALGTAFVGTHGRPSPDALACVRADLAGVAKTGKMVYADRGSGARDDLEVFQVAPEGAGCLAGGTSIASSRYMRGSPPKWKGAPVAALKAPGRLDRSDGLTEAEVKDIIKNHGPQLILHPQDEWQPMDADVYFNGSELDATQNALIPKPAVNLHGDIKTAKAYVFANYVCSQFTDLQFWFFYGYNGATFVRVEGWVESAGAYVGSFADNFNNLNSGQHMGDWEHATLRVDNTTKKVVAVGYASHGDTEWYAPPADGKVKVYSALHMHGSYPVPGEILELGGWESKDIKIGTLEVKVFSRNICAESSTILDCSTNYEIVQSNFLSDVTLKVWLGNDYKETSWGPKQHHKDTFTISIAGLPIPIPYETDDSGPTTPSFSVD